MNVNDLNLKATYSTELFFELSPDLLCIAGYDGYFKRVNAAVSKVLRYTEQELLSKPIDEFIHPEDRDITARYRAEIKANKPLMHFENRYLTKTGEIVWLSWTAIAFDSQKVVYAIAKNVTHNKKMEEERNTLLSHLTRKNKELKQASYTTSHDLRSPVNNLLLGFSLLDVSKIEDQETLDFIEILKASAEGLKQTLNNYVDILSNRESLNVEIEDVNLAECLNTVLQSINSLVHDSKAVFHIDFSGLENIKFNKTYLESIFLNLVTNSIKYARPDLFPVISIHSRDFNGLKQLIVSDNGRGFDMSQVKDKIFGLHQKFHNHIDSKGIGLYLVYNHVVSLGAQISVDSEVNRGTTFTITFKK
jgi:PAS domain S-box-containing protein